MNDLTLARRRLARLGAAACLLALAAASHAQIGARLPDLTISGGGPLNVQTDINRDGRRDLISTSPGVNHRGVVEVRYGSSSGFKKKADFRYVGPMDWAQVGSSPMAVDVNGDGWPDLVVGAYSYSGAKQYAGAILVFFGGPNGFSPTPSQIIEGPEENSFFGFTAHPLGDFNHDGYADIAVSASTDGGTHGTIYVYTGSPKGLVLKPESTLSAMGLPWFEFGRVFDTGATTTSGIADIAVGVPTSISEGRPGLVFVYKGAPSGYSNQPAEVVAAPDFLGPLDEFGSSVSILGDVDGDGFPDIAVSAPGYVANNSGDTVSSGAIFVYYGSASGFVASGRRQEIEAPNADAFSFFGEVMLGQRDFNHDGHADLLVGASLRQRGLTGTGPFPGFLWLYTGGPGGFTRTPYKRSGAPGSVDGLGAIFDVADVTGDGQMDVITANPVAPSDPQGLLRVFRGASGLK